MESTPEIIEDIIISPAGDTIENSFEPPILDLDLDRGLGRDRREENGRMGMERDRGDRGEERRSERERERGQNLSGASGVGANVIRSNPFIRMPAELEAPVANYYAEIRWGHGFEQWPLVRFSTPGDGSCMFHAITNSFFRPYHKEVLDGKKVARNKIIAGFRKELAEKLSSKVSTAKDSPTHYDLLNRGYTAEWAKGAKLAEYTLAHMQKELDSDTYIGYGYIELIGNALNKDIYVLEAIRRDIYRQVDEDLELTIKGDRNSIILYYMDNGHYELVGTKNEDGTFDTYFSPDHSLIQFLFNRVQAIIRSVRQPRP